MKNVLKRILTEISHRVLLRYRPFIVGITGSVGKTSAKEAIYSVLTAKYSVRKSDKNYNTEIGVPLTILGIPYSGRNPFGWVASLVHALSLLLKRDSQYPDYLVLEMGADHPGDITHLAHLAPPLVGVITAIGETPVHVEFFESPETLAHEKANLIAALPIEGYAVLNADDKVVMSLKSRTKAHVLTFGFGEEADIRIMRYRLRSENDSDSAGISFSLQHGDKMIYVELKNTFGKQQAYSAASACATGLILNMSLTEIAEGLKHYTSPPGRLKLLKGNKGALILDDSYNSSPQAVSAALEVLREFSAKRRIAILGDMLELGSYTEVAHRELGSDIAQSVQIIIGVGERMKFALEEAKRFGVPESSIFWFPSSVEAGKKLDGLLRSGDVVLVKGSQSIRMERAVLEIMAESEKASDLLVRQTVDWLRKK